MSGAFIAGVGMTAFGRQEGRGIRNLALEAASEALADAGIDASRVDRVYFANALAATVTQQEMIRGQVAFRGHVLGRLPLVNVENACASGGSAFMLAVEAVANGQADVVLAIGAEQMYHADRSRAFNALRGSTDVADIGEYTAGTMSANSLLMDYYADVARRYVEEFGASVHDFALVAVKNRNHAAHNPLAQLRQPQTTEDVLNARMIVPPLTLPMCSPMTDGAAAVLVCSARAASKLAGAPIKVRSCRMASGATSQPVDDATRLAYEDAQLGPNDVDVFELHDAAAPAELLQYHEIGLCPEGDGFRLVREGVTALGGRSPINCSGGLLSRGHAVGATGCAQLYELVRQLRGQCDRRQVEGARLALAVNGGGWLDGSYALAVATILERERL